MPKVKATKEKINWTSWKPNDFVHQMTVSTE
jgi:hypothetical protein